VIASKPEALVVAVAVSLTVWDGLIANTTFAVLVIPPPDPEIVSVKDPVGELPGMVTVSVDE
jgi:hypothetical protein